MKLGSHCRAGGIIAKHHFSEMKKMLATLRYMNKGKNLLGSNPFTSSLLICMKPKIIAGVFGQWLHPAPT